MKNREYYEEIQHDDKAYVSYRDALDAITCEFLTQLAKAENDVEKWMCGWNYIYELTLEGFAEDPAATETELKMATVAALHIGNQMVTAYRADHPVDKNIDLQLYDEYIDDGAWYDYDVHNLTEIVTKMLEITEKYHFPIRSITF